MSAILFSSVTASWTGRKVSTRRHRRSQGQAQSSCADSARCILLESCSPHLIPDRDQLDKGPLDREDALPQPTRHRRCQLTKVFVTLPIRPAVRADRADRMIVARRIGIKAPRPTDLSMSVVLVDAWSLTIPTGVDDRAL